MCKILVIENEYTSVKSAFELSSLCDFNNRLMICNISKAQDIKYEELDSYNAIFVDLILARNSKSDGYSILEKINDMNNNEDLLKKTVIITGNNNIKEELSKRNLKVKHLTKPLRYKDISRHIKECI